MVAAQDQVLTGKANPVCNLLNILYEVRWSHSGIAPKLVDLVAGRLDQHWGMRCHR